MTEPFTTQLFIFDSFVQLIIITAIAIMFVKTRELWSLSLQKGVKYLNNAMLFYLLSFTFKYLTTLIDYFSDNIYGSIHTTQIGIILSFLNIYGAFMGGLYLAYSLVWRNFEKDRIKHFHPLRIMLLNFIVLMLIVADIFLIVKLGVQGPFIFFGVVIAALLYSISANCEQCKKRHIHTHNFNPFLSMVGLGLGVYVVFLLENLLVNFLFAVHYYTSALAAVFVVALLYNILKLTK